MDFKTRFQGRMSHISKDGAIDHVVLSTEKMVPIGRTPDMPTPPPFKPQIAKQESSQSVTVPQKPAAPSLEPFELLDIASQSSSLNVLSD